MRSLFATDRTQYGTLCVVSSIYAHKTDLVCAFNKIGTIPMKAEKQGGCVDSRLNVYGTANLKVAGIYAPYLHVMRSH